MKSTAAITPEINAALARFAAKNSATIFSDAEHLCSAEITRIHSCSNASDDASLLAGFFPQPEPVSTFAFDAENRLEKFADGSLYLRSSGDSEVWAFASDYYQDKVAGEKWVTAGLLSFFGEEEPENPSAFAVTVRSHFYGPLDQEGLAADERGNALEFSTREEAAAWISQEEAGRYHLSHNESGRPTYIIHAIA